MKNLKISIRLLVCFGLATLILVASIVVSILNINKVANNMKLFNEECYQVEGLNWAAILELDSMEKSIYKSTTSPNRTLVKKYTEEITRGMKSLDNIILNLKSKDTIDIGKMSKIESALQATKPIIEDLVVLLDKNKNTQALERVQSELVPQIEILQNNLKDISFELNTKAQNFVIYSNETKMNSIVILVVILFVSVIVSIILALYVTRSITKPLKQITEAANSLSRGDFDYEISYISKDELGVAAVEFSNSITTIKKYIGVIYEVLNKMSTGDMTASVDIDFIGGFEPIKNSIDKILYSLNNTLSKIDIASDQVASGSEQVASGSQALSQGSTEQASSIQQLSASINEVSEQVKQNAVNSEQASKLTSKSAKDVEIGSKQMINMTKAMSDIKQSSNEIAKIIKTINDIAFQTNILALNAAVEAARAGTAGKGFAVVADEVRNLASKSAQAAKNTTELIENSIKSVEKGTKITDETEKIMFKIVEEINKVVLLINDISKASNEQASSIMEINEGVLQISSVVQNNSATSEQSAAASEELNSQAQLLKELVDEFKLKKDIIYNDETYEADDIESLDQIEEVYN